MNSNQFVIVPCSACPGKVLLKTAFIWRELVFCSPDCIRKHIRALQVPEGQSVTGLPG